MNLKRGKNNKQKYLFCKRKYSVSSLFGEFTGNIVRIEKITFS